MKPPSFTEAVAGQAIYTWSRANVDGSTGVGFSVISGLLDGAIDWLHRLQPEAFKVSLDDPARSVSDAAAHAEIRRGFSEVGRLVKDGVGIIYCKTADGTSDVKRRPADVIHAVMGSASALDLSCIRRIDDGFWKRRLAGPEGLPVWLPDISLSDLISQDAPFKKNEHDEEDCAAGHPGAREFLRHLQDVAHNNNRITLDLPRRSGLVGDILLALPVEAYQFVALNPYVTTAGVIYRLEIPVPSGMTSRQQTPLETCPLRRKVFAAAGKYLLVAQPRMADYIQEILTPRQRLEPTTNLKQNDTRTHRRPKSTSPRPAPDEPVSALSVVLRYRAAASADGRPLNSQDGLSAGDQLRKSGYDFTQLATESSDVLRAMFGAVDDRSSLTRWSRLLGSLPCALLVDMWNRTGIAAFLGLLLLRPSSDFDLKGTYLLPLKDFEQGQTEAILRIALRLPGGDLRLAAMLDHGLASTEGSRRYLVQVFESSPQFLFDRILMKAELTTWVRLEYIRLGYRSWTALRRLPTAEADAFAVVLRPGLLHRIRAALLRKQ